MMTNTTQRKKVLEIYNTALQVVRGEQCVKHYLLSKQFSPRLVANEKIAIIAIGKAAYSMARGAYAVVKKNFLAGLVISKQGHLPNTALNSRFEYYESSHPVPSDKSLIAGQKLVNFITHLPEHTHLIVLVSGGTSALVEQLKSGVSLNDLVKVNNWLLASGLAINEVNVVRQRLSTIKGGQLASLASHLKVSNLLLSDVLSNDPYFIGSGLFVKKTLNTTVASLPDWLKRLVESPVDNELNNNRTEVFTDLVATNTILVDKIATLCDSTANTFKQALAANVEQEAENIVSKISQGGCGFYIWGGEPTVKLSGGAGKGGRNQHLALLIANRIKGLDNIIVLCLGTDGTDGNTDDAGALVDGETVLRGEQDGYSIAESIQAYDSATFLQASGDVVNTGPTGTNVMDIVVAYKW